MSRILSAIITGFTIVSLLPNTALAGPFHIAPPAPAATTQPKTEAAAPDPKKLAEAQAIALSVRHCLVLSDVITEQFKLVDAFNTQPDLDNLPKNLDESDKEKTMLYMMERPDIPAYGFLIPETWKTAHRDQRIRFNSIVTLRLDEILGFRYGGFAFADNCKPTLEGDITKDAKGFDHAKVNMPLAFDSKESKLSYLLTRQPGYNWQIDDLLINNVGIANYAKKDLSQSIMQKGLPATIKEICKTSSFSNLKCD